MGQQEYATNGLAITVGQQAFFVRFVNHFENLVTLDITIYDKRGGFDFPVVNFQFWVIFLK